MAVDFTRGLVPLDTSPLMNVFERRKRDEQIAIENERQNRLDQLAMDQFAETKRANLISERISQHNADTNREIQRQNQLNSEQAREAREIEMEGARMENRAVRAEIDSESLPYTLAQIQEPLEVIAYSLDAGMTPPDQMVFSAQEAISKAVSDYGPGIFGQNFRDLDKAFGNMINKGNEATNRDYQDLHDELEKLRNVEPIKRGNIETFKLDDGTYIQRNRDTGQEMSSPRNAEPSQAQWQASRWATAMADADMRLVEFENVLTGPGGRIEQELFNEMQSEELQAFLRAEEAFINSTLREESGAAISDSERVRARLQYIPQPGDDPLVLADKRRNRQVQLAGFRSQAGPAMDLLNKELGIFSEMSAEDFESLE